MAIVVVHHDSNNQKLWYHRVWIKQTPGEKTVRAGPRVPPACTQSPVCTTRIQPHESVSAVMLYHSSQGWPWACSRGSRSCAHTDAVQSAAITDCFATTKPTRALRDYVKYFALSCALFQHVADGVDESHYASTIRCHANSVVHSCVQPSALKRPVLKRPVLKRRRNGLCQCVANGSHGRKASQMPFEN